MNRRIAIPVCLTSLLALFVLSAGNAFAASSVRVEIKISGAGASGGSLLAISSTGKAVRTKLGSKTVSLNVPKATISGTTLQLVSKSGRFLGPVVLASASGGKKAYLTLGRGAGAKSSLKLGTATVKKGYAALSKPLATKSLLTPSYAVAVKGAPTGSGRLGLQKSSRKASAAQFQEEEGGGGGNGGGGGGNGGNGGNGGDIPSGTDPDRDGLTSNIDVDDNGNGVLDNQDSTQRPISAGLFATLGLSPGDAGTNFNATGVTQAQIDDNVSGEDRFNFIFFFGSGDLPAATGAYVDCGALSYCNSVTGTAVLGGLSESSPDLPRGTLWRNWRPNGNPQGNGLEKNTVPSVHTTWAVGLQPRATTAEMAPGDLFNVVFRGAGGNVITPVALASYPVTVPAIKTVTSGDVATTILNGNPASPGSNDSSAVAVSAVGDLEFDYWRPQRRGIAGTGEAALVDMGNLHYTISIGGLRTADGTEVRVSREFSCNAAGEPVSPESPDGDFYGPADPTPDAAPNRANTRTYTTNLRSCLSGAISAGYLPSGTSLAGAHVNVGFTASGENRSGGADRATMKIALAL
jgi:hypothetical protein